MKNKNLIILIVSVIFLIILTAIGLLVFNQHQNNANKLKPTIVSISPTSLLAGASEINLKVYGRNLETGSVINWNGSPIKTDNTFVSYGFLQTMIPASSLATPGEYNITITNPPPNARTSNPVKFIVNSVFQIK